MKVVIAVVLAALLAAAAFLWRDSGYRRALATLQTNALDDAALTTVAVHADKPEARAALLAALRASAYGTARPQVIAIVAGAEELNDADLAESATACVVRQGLDACRALVSDYDESAAVSAALIRFLQRAADSSDVAWRGSAPRLVEMIQKRPRSRATLDVLIAAWRRAPDDALVPLIFAYEYPLVEARFVETHALGSEELRLLLCQANDCHATDLEALVNLVRARVQAKAPDDDRDVDLKPVLALGPQEAWTKVTRTSKWMTVERRAFVSIGKDAVPSLDTLYAAPSRALWTFAAMALAEINAAAFREKVKRELKSKIPGAPEKAILALSAATGPEADVIYGLAAVHPLPSVSGYAQKRGRK